MHLQLCHLILYFSPADKIPDNSALPTLFRFPMLAASSLFWKDCAPELWTLSGAGVGHSLPQGVVVTFHSKCTSTALGSGR